MSKKIVHTHWLYGHGPEKKLEFKHAVATETNCTTCIHVKVCTRSEEKRCVNFELGTSQHSNCHACIHHYTRFDKDKVPCFHCYDYQPRT